MKPKYLKSVQKENLKKIVKIVGDFETESGGIESTNVWKQFRKAYPEKSEPIPTGVKILMVKRRRKKKTKNYLSIGRRKDPGTRKHRK